MGNIREKNDADFGNAASVAYVKGYRVVSNKLLALLRLRHSVT